MRFGDVEGFDKLVECAENTERKKAMKNVTLSENDKLLIAEWLEACTSLKDASKVTKLSESYLSSLKNMKRDVVRGSTYEVFKNICQPEASPTGDFDIIEDEVDVVDNNEMSEFEIMTAIDSYLEGISDDQEKISRILQYMAVKYTKWRFN